MAKPDLLLCLINDLCKTKIANFDLPFTEENICRLDITVHDVAHRDESVGDLVKDLAGFFFSEFVSSVHFLFKTSFVTKIEEDVKVITGFLDVNEFDNMLALNVFVDVNLPENNSIKFSVGGDLGVWNDFHSYFLVIFGVGGFVNAAKGASAKRLVWVKCVFFDLFEN